MYFDALIAPDTVNTMPDELIAAIRAVPGRRLPSRIEDDLPAAREILAPDPQLRQPRRRAPGGRLASFAKSWESLVKAIEAKRPLARTG